MPTLGTRVLKLVTVIAVATVTTFSPLARAVDFTDIWWNPAESGWGVNLVQADTFIFATFFIYGEDKKPTWYTAQLQFDGKSKFAGPLLLTQGTYFANPWKTGDSALQQVGTAAFTPSTSNAYQGTLTYTVTNLPGSPTVTKAIERQTLTTIILGGAYSGAETGAYAQCSQAGAYRDFFDLQVTHLATGTSTFKFAYSSVASCTLTGMLAQRGQLYFMPGADYVCTENGNTIINTKAAVSELKATAQGVEGRLSAAGVGDCRLDLQFSAVLQ